MKTKKSIFILCILIFVPFVSSCVVEEVELEYEFYKEGYTSSSMNTGGGVTGFIIMDNERWGFVWYEIMYNEISDPPSLPDVDFNNYMLLSVEKKPSDGCSLTISKVVAEHWWHATAFRFDTRIVPCYEEDCSNPGEEDSYSYHIIKVSRSSIPETWDNIGAGVEPRKID